MSIADCRPMAMVHWRDDIRRAVLAGCAAESPEQLAAKNRLLTSYPPPGEARIWVFRNYQPEITREEPYVRINGGLSASRRWDAPFITMSRRGIM